MAYRTTRSLSDMSGEKFIDSRDLVNRFEELESEREDLESEVEEAKDAVQDAYHAREELDTAETEAAHHAAMSAENEARKALADWDIENAGEFDTLRSINEEGQNVAADWSHGATLIRDDYFTDYARELVSDIGGMPREIPDYIVIDWEATADNLKADYTTVTIEGTDYYVR
jgi:hypothetical protein